MYDQSIQQLASWMRQAQSAVFFGGAGVSTESGIPDFRSAKGLYTTSGHTLPPEYLLSHECLVEQPEAFFAFHRAHLVHPNAQPNTAHLALAHFERLGHLAAVVTQNIDGLHQKAGSQVVYELHGSVERNYCLGAPRHTFALSDIPDEPIVPVCPHTHQGSSSNPHGPGDSGSVGNGSSTRAPVAVRPDVVLYGEQLDDAVVQPALEALANADLIIVGGTSLNVYPAAGMIKHFPGTPIALINLEPTSFDQQADLAIHRPIGKVLSEVKEQL